MSKQPTAPLQINGWTIFARPLFLGQLNTLRAQVKALQEKIKVGYPGKANKRAYQSSDDAYLVFRKMLADGHPPDDWAQLLAEASGQASG